MPLVKWTLIGVLLLPVAELAVFIVLGMTIGWFWTFGLALATSVMGVVLLKRIGRDRIGRFGTTLAQNGFRSVAIEASSLAQVAGGILLVLPGFITDLVGAFLVVRPLRSWAGSTISQLAKRKSRRKSGDSVIDLEPTEWHQVGDPANRERNNPLPRRTA
jgi:UPF0716 protein FxsA